MPIYALKYRNKFDFICVSKTQKGFKRKIDLSFWNWKGLQAKSSEITIEDFLSEFEKVKITIEPYRGDYNADLYY